MLGQRLESLQREWNPPPQDASKKWRPLPQSYPNWVVNKCFPTPDPIAAARNASTKIRENSAPISAKCTNTIHDWWEGRKQPDSTCPCGEGHFHCYQISGHPAWNKWRTLSGGRTNFWWCDSLKQAATHYSWTTFSGGNFNQLSAALQSSILSGNLSLVQTVCLKILDWGGVLTGKTKSTKSINWILTSRNLSRDIIDAAAGLIPYSPWPRGFFGSHVPMNSGSTKIFSAAALVLSCDTGHPKQDVLIYDGRVGSALGLLARRLMYPTVLRGRAPAIQNLFLRADGSRSSKRNPSMITPCITFPPMNGNNRGFHAALSTRNSDEVRAWFARRGAELIQNAIGSTGPHSDFIQAEQALFMLGYDVKHLCSGSLRPQP